MSIKRLASYLAGGAAAAVAAAMLNAAPANAEGDIYTNAVGSSGTQLGYLGEASTEQSARDQAKAACAAAGDDCTMIFDTVKNDCLAVAISDTGIWTSAVRPRMDLAEEAALTQLTSKFPGQGGRSVVVHCGGGGMEANDPAAAPEAEAPKPAPQPQEPCIPDPFNLNFPGAC